MVTVIHSWIVWLLLFLLLYEFVLVNNRSICIRSKTTISLLLIQKMDEEMINVISRWILCKIHLSFFFAFVRLSGCWLEWVDSVFGFRWNWNVWFWKLDFPILTWLNLWLMIWGSKRRFLSSTKDPQNHLFLSIITRSLVYTQLRNTAPH